MPTEFERKVTVFVRYRVIGIDTEEVKAIAERWEVSKATVSDIRKGKKGVGGTVLRKIADADFAGDMNRLRKEAEDFASANPDLMDPSIPLLQRAVGALTIEDASRAPTLVEAYRSAHAAIKNPDVLTFGAAIELVRTVAASVESSSDSGHNPPSRSDLQNGNQRRLKRRKASG